MKQEISFHLGIPNSYVVDLESLISNDKYSFLLDNSVKNEYYFNDYITESSVRKAIKEYSKKSKKKKKNKQVPINEMTAKELIAGADSARLHRSRDKRIICRFEKVMPVRGWIVFDVTSQYTPGKHYKVYVKMKEANDMKYFKEFKKHEIIRLFLKGDLRIECSCPDFRYRYRYMAWQMGYGLYKELRYPHIVNPQLKGSVCKHCLAVLRVLQFNASSIAKAMKNSKYFKKRVED
jgi:hypothetical protein